MGTRCLIAVQYNNEYKIAQYCQFDGYPDGQGLRVLNVLRNIDINKLKDQVAQLLNHTNDTIKDVYENIGLSTDRFLTFEETQTLYRECPELHRDTGYNILNLVYNGRVDRVINKLNFAINPLCEYVYVIDLDKLKFEVYKQSKENMNISDRFYFLKENNTETSIKQIGAHSINALPTDKIFRSLY